MTESSDDQRISYVHSLARIHLGVNGNLNDETAMLLNSFVDDLNRTVAVLTVSSKVRILCRLMNPEDRKVQAA